MKINSVQESMVVCHLCNGSGKSPYITWMTCKCCDGTGKITQEQRDIKLKISRDIAQRMLNI